MVRIEDFYFKMLLIRKFEERILELFSEGKLFGTTHAYIGQEADAVGVITNLEEGDKIFSSHRCHGHYLARTNDVVGLMGELMGKSIGVCSGLGGSQHLYKDGFFSSGVQGSYMPIIVGLALAEKMNKSNNIVVGFIGDGTLGEGSTYEALNLMSLLRVPVLLVLENNLYAQTTPIESNLAGKISSRISAFNIDAEELNTTDVMEINEVSKRIIHDIRNDKKPRALILNTYRFCAHSKGDDMRSTDEIEKHRKDDPLTVLEKQMTEMQVTGLRNRVLELLTQAEVLCTKSDYSEFEIR
jgi:TPP-dependent pyruvate/acetoin dehydrogenase alpha subunit